MQLVGEPRAHFLDQVREDAERFSGGEGLDAQGCEAFGRACEAAFETARRTDLGPHVLDVEGLLEVGTGDGVG
jgi:hypothetical protein